MGAVRPLTHNEDQRHHVTIIVSNEMDEFKNRPAYGWGEFTSEMFGSLSFILGIAFVALIDWIFATLLWFCGKLPYIPAMPPILNSDLYVRDIYYHVRHELFGDPIPMTISQTYLKVHEHRRDAFKAVAPSAEKSGSDHRHPQFPRMHQRKSSLAIMSEAIMAVSHHHHDESLLQERLHSLSEAISGKEETLVKGLQKRSSYPPDVSSRQWMSLSKTRQPKSTSSSVHGMPEKWSEPKITISAPDEDAVREGQPEATSTGYEEGYDTGQDDQTVNRSSLPGIDRQHRPSRAESVLRDLDVAEASQSAEVEDETPLPPLPAAAATRERRRSSAYRTKPRRKSHAVAPAPAPSIHEDSEDDEPPDWA